MFMMLQRTSLDQSQTSRLFRALVSHQIASLQRVTKHLSSHPAINELAVPVPIMVDAKTTEQTPNKSRDSHRTNVKVKDKEALGVVANLTKVLAEAVAIRASVKTDTKHKGKEAVVISQPLIDNH